MCKFKHLSILTTEERIILWFFLIFGMSLMKFGSLIVILHWFDDILFKISNTYHVHKIKRVCELTLSVHFNGRFHFVFSWRKYYYYGFVSITLHNNNHTLIFWHHRVARLHAILSLYPAILFETRHVDDKMYPLLRR